MLKINFNPIGKNGVCPDSRVGGKDDIETISGERQNGVTIIKYRRPLRTNEPINDRAIPQGEASVIAAIGPLNSRKEANAHAVHDKTHGKAAFLSDFHINFYFNL